jgi:thiol:disulfide interchange protein
MNRSALRLAAIALVMIGLAFVLFRSINSLRNSDAGRRAIFAEEISFADARSKAKSEEKDVFVLASATWCPFCAALDREALADESVQTAISEKTVPVRVDISGRTIDFDRWPEIERLKIETVPTLILFGPDGRELDRISGVVNAEDLKLWIQSRGKLVPEILGGAGELDT